MLGCHASQGRPYSPWSPTHRHSFQVPARALGFLRLDYHNGGAAASTEDIPPLREALSLCPIHSSGRASGLQYCEELECLHCASPVRTSLQELADILEFAFPQDVFERPEELRVCTDESAGQLIGRMPSVIGSRRTEEPSVRRASMTEEDGV